MIRCFRLVFLSTHRHSRVLCNLLEKMEGGLGSTRMGSRSSTRHGPASVFQGRVRRWNKSWAPVMSSPSQVAAAGRVLLYKWTPITLPTTNGTKESTPEDPAPTKTSRFIPVAVVLHDREEETRKSADETGTLPKLEQEVQVAYAVTGEPEALLPQDAPPPAGGAGDAGNGSNAEPLGVLKRADCCGEGDKFQGSREAIAELQEEGHAAEDPELIAMVQF